MPHATANIGYSTFIEDILENNKSLFVLGAGSSIGFSFPTGEALVADISDNFVKDLEKIELRELPANAPFKNWIDLISAAKKFASNLKIVRPRSIDEYLSRKKPEFDDIGKIAIALFMIMREPGIANDYNRLFHDSDDNWQKELFQNHLFNSHFEPSLNEISLKTEFISFNYEYSFESAFDFFINNNFKSNDGDFKRILSCKHVYGLVHNRLLHSVNTDRISLEYIIKAANNIDVMYSTRTAFASKIAGYKEWISTFDKIYFLGFGFNQDNLRKLQFPEVLNKNVSIFGTAKNKNDNQIINIQDIFDDFQNRPQIYNCNCKELITKHFESN
jgi:hypothetical protein